MTAPCQNKSTAKRQTNICNSGIVAPSQDLPKNQWITHRLYVLNLTTQETVTYNVWQLNSLHQHKTGNTKRDTHTHTKNIYKYTFICLHKHNQQCGLKGHNGCFGQAVTQMPSCRTSYSSHTSLGEQPKLKLHCLIRAGGTTLSAGSWASQ